MSTTEHRDWYAWHADYQNSSSDLSRRLAVVQDEIRAVLPAAPPQQQFRIVSICAGQAHDLIGVLTSYPRAASVSARLVELNERNVEIIRETAAAAGLNLDVVQGDAADTSLYAGAVPADLVIAVGIFGNIPTDDIFATIHTLPQFCASGATVIWSRGQRRLPPMFDEIRAEFVSTGFSEVAFHAPPDTNYRIGVARYKGGPQTLLPAHLFTFIR